MEPSTSKFKAAEGDWICSDMKCKYINFSRRNKCNRCGKDREEGPAKKKLEQEVGKHKSFFNPHDWHCLKCGIINRPSRKHCFVCNASKFKEERTGYGGGFYDLDVVEYIKRDDSDGEYDEFGRRKKKKTDKRSSDAKEDEEEEEEDMLSKYDLSDWGINEDEGEEIRSRSRSPT